jgi:methylornithine synthase
MRWGNVEEFYSLCSAAAQVRANSLGTQVFIYGFAYFSTYCRNDCRFCFYRKQNTKCQRYRKDPERISEIAQLLERSGVHLIDLTSGEDPILYHGSRFEPLVRMVRLVNDATDLGIMVSPGVLPRSALRSLKEAGADWYALYQETHNKRIYSKLRIGQDYGTRLEAKLNAHKEDLLIEDGILLGVGESHDDRVDSIFGMKRIGASQVRAMGFVPQDGTPMQNYHSPPIADEMTTMAVMRLVHQEKLMPASLDIDGLKGLGLRLASGANVISSVIPPKLGLAGVAQAQLGVDEGLRTVDAVRPHIEQLGLKIASKNSYAKWMDAEKERQFGTPN